MALNERQYFGFRRTRGDSSRVDSNSRGVPALIVPTTDRDMHFASAADERTDWNVSNPTHPTIYVHSETTPATDYGSLAHDATDLVVTSVGGGIRLVPVGDVQIDNTFGLIVGHSAQITVSDGDGSTNLIPELQVLGTAKADSSMVLASFNTTNDNTVAPLLALVKSGNGTIGSAATVVVSGEVLGEIIAFGADATDLESPAGAVRFEVDGTAGTGDMPGRILLMTTADGAETLTERVRVASTGLITVAAGSTPASVATTPGTAHAGSVTATGGLGGNTSIATTGTGGIGGGFSFTGGAGGTAASATTAGTGGAGGAFAVTTGAGAASAVTGAGTGTGGAGGAISLTAANGGAVTTSTGTNTGGAGGAITLTTGTGGAAQDGTDTGGAGGLLSLTAGAGGNSDTGGAGGGVTITAGNAGTGGNAAGGVITLVHGTATGTAAVGYVTVDNATAGVRIGTTQGFGTTTGTNWAGFKTGTAPAGTFTTGAAIFSDGTAVKKIIADGTVTNVET